MSRTRFNPFDVVIVGGGVLGLAMASLLAARKICAAGRIAVVADQPAAVPSAGDEWDLRVFALSRTSERLLKICGIWNSLPPARVFPYERMCVWDTTSTPQGAGSLAFDCAQIGEPNLGHIVEARALQWQCLQTARAAGVVLIEGAVASIDAGQENVTLHLNDGRELRAELLVAADGAESKTRQLLRISTAGHAYHQDALAGHVRTAKSHENTAWQRFLSTGPLAFLPLGDGRSSIVWSVGRDRASHLCAMDPHSFNQALTEASGEVLGRCELTTALARVPLKLQYAVDYARPRAALLGDAAHVVHPLAGQGLNLGLLDCGALAQVLGEVQDAAQLGDYKHLRRYERWRRSENLLAAAALDGLERLFTYNGPKITALRRAGLSAVEGLPFMKRRFAKRALGLAGDVPEFLKAI